MSRRKRTCPSNGQPIRGSYLQLRDVSCPAAFSLLFVRSRVALDIQDQTLKPKMNASLMFVALLGLVSIGLVCSAPGESALFIAQLRQSSGRDMYWKNLYDAAVCVP